MSRKNIRITAFVLCVAFLAVVSAFYLNKEKSVCIGVPLLSEKETAEYNNYIRKDISEEILFMGMPVAADTDTDTLYISQNMDGTTLYTELEGLITTADEKYPLYFAADKAFDDFSVAVAEGHNFTLIADTLDGSYMKYNVVFTNLPVIRVTGELAYVNEDERNVYAGDITVWNPCYATSGKYSVQSSLLEWNRRGQSTFGFDKKSWKLSLKNKDGTNNDLDLTGIDQQDDDWILNAMALDDTKVKEMLCMQLWNSLYSKTQDYNYRMSSGEYAEVVSNGKYYGLYLIQRRVDAKYLELAEDEVLIKGLKSGGSAHIADNYEIEQAACSEDSVWKAMEGVFTRDDVSDMEIRNWIDVSLFIDFGYMPDNSGYQNTFYIIKNAESKPQISITLWDTDYAFGVGWGTDGFAYKPDGADENRRYRLEYESMRTVYPQLDNMLAQRWSQLRKDILAEDNILRIIAEKEERINLCGAMNRDKSLWGLYYKGADSNSSLREYITKRLTFLDECHSKFIQ